MFLFVLGASVVYGVQLLDPDSSIRGHLGLKEEEATMVSGVYEGLPADAAGLEPYDVIVSVAGKSPAPPAAVRKALREVETGKTIVLEVIHRGQKKTVTVTPEKYDSEKIEKSKLNAIAAATEASTPTALSGIPGSLGWDKNLAEAIAQAGGQWQGHPFVATMPGQGGQPGKPMTLWRSYAGPSAEELAKITAEAQEEAKRAQAQAETARAQAEQMFRGRLLGPAGAAAGSGGPNAADLNKILEERMKKMEQMMQQLLEQQRNAKPVEEKTESKS